MMTISDVRNYLHSLYPEDIFYNGTIDKNQNKCIGVYARGNSRPYIAIGGLDNTSYSTLPVFIVVHWTPNASKCERKANEIYQSLFSSSNQTIGGKKVISFNMVDSAPVDIQRDENNVCEMVIRMVITYER